MGLANAVRVSATISIVLNALANSVVIEAVFAIALIILSILGIHFVALPAPAERAGA